MLQNKPVLTHRKSLRLKHYNYSTPGFYFITLCVIDKQCLLGEIFEAEESCAVMIKSHFGEIVENTWFDLVNHVANIALHEFVIMPNHVHGIIQITTENRQYSKAVNIAEVIRQFKTFSSRRINQLRNTTGTPVWQRNYYEHIIRDEKAYINIAEYINANVLRWQQDIYHSQ